MAKKKNRNQKVKDRNTVILKRIEIGARSSQTHTSKKKYTRKRKHKNKSYD